MAKLKVRSYDTSVWKVTGPKDGPLKYNGQFKATTGKVNGHERREDGMIISLSCSRKVKIKNLASSANLKLKGLIASRSFTQRFAISHDDINETEVSNWDGKTATISSKKIVIA